MDYVIDRDMSRRGGVHARRVVESRFGMEAMVKAYMGVYDSVLGHDAQASSV